MSVYVQSLTGPYAMTDKEIKELLPCPPERNPRAAIFLSGSGSNAQKILELYARDENAPFQLEALVTDKPEDSRAYQLGEEYDIPVIANDIGEFYRRHGFSRVCLSSEKAQQVRANWTAQLREQLAPLELDFGVLAGFMSLSNIVEDFPCLNVHPGDLTYLINGERYLVGLHTLPVERALLAGLSELRSSVIIATSYTGSGNGMDSGPILGLSQGVSVDWQNYTLDKLKQIAEERPEKKPPGGFKDDLAYLAQWNLDRLKKHGDWIVFPNTVWDFAAGSFAVNSSGNLFYRTEKGWHAVKTVVYGEQKRDLLFNEE